MVDTSHAYNTVWQLRADAWCRLEEAAERVGWPTTGGGVKEEYTAVVNELLAQLTPLEPYWAFPGALQFARTQRLFTAGQYDKFSRMVSRVNPPLGTDSYRSR